MAPGEPHDDLLPTILEVCEEFFASTSPAVRHDLDALLRNRGITGGPGWLIDMLALTRRRIERPTGHDQSPADESAFETRGD
jgi:hypothetical protein